MRIPSIFFNPTLRGNVLQALLFSLTVPIASALTTWSLGPTVDTGSQSFSILIITLGVATFILVHHVAGLLLGRFRLVVIDLLAVMLEIAIVGFLIFRGFWPLYTASTFIFLILTITFRTATISASPERLWKQKLAFWGGCRATHRSPWMVLVNRPPGKPLIRGESVFVIIFRCVILVALGLGLPLFATYKIFFQPAHANVYTRVLASQDYGPGITNLNPGTLLTSVDLGNAVVLVPQPDFEGTTFRVDVLVSNSSSTVALACTTFETSGSTLDQAFTMAQCPVNWVDIDRMTVNVTFPPFFTPSGIYAGFGDKDDILRFTQPIPIFPEFNLFAYMTWTSRQILPSNSFSLLNAFLPGKTIKYMEVNSLLSRPDSVPQISGTSSNTESPSTTITMTIVQRAFITKFIEDHTNDSALDGLSTLGGLWTTLDALFMLVFGASVLYFAYGKRPLSALGIVHVFQSRTLKRNLHEDFPVLLTEGGQPGSQSAGLVAFLRDRLLDTDEADGEAQHIAHEDKDDAAPWV
ncbi:Short-chain dehydrogenase/reductase family protein [Mycena venus]|uniref:Short-chain dehydrogenase/reductase family protein n=1 Tax=Mycena venus TaxID=2733690 RepID=A0A8H6XHH6_9AGAR|nr:Short-chain dehydrogenase/reductase family protein [Mycena venus]